MTARVAGPRKPSQASAAAAPPRPSSAKPASTAAGSSRKPTSATPAPAAAGPKSKSTTTSSAKPASTGGSQPPADPSLGTRLQGPAPYRDWLANRAPSRTPRQAKAHAVASSLLGLCAYAMFINGIRYGPSGVTGWLKAKFLNKPMQGLSAVNPNQPVQKPTGPVST